MREAWHPITELDVLIETALRHVPLHVLRSPSVGLSYLADRIEKAQAAVTKKENHVKQVVPQH